MNWRHVDCVISRVMRKFVIIDTPRAGFLAPAGENRGKSLDFFNRNSPSQTGGTMKITIVLALMISFASAFGCNQGRSAIDTQPPASAVKSTVNEISPENALPNIRAAYSQFVDVRTPEEYAAGHAVRAINIPLETLAANLDRLESNEPVYLICETGKRSGEAGQILTDAGFKWVFTVAGGTAAWKAAGLPMEFTRR